MTGRIMLVTLVCAGALVFNTATHVFAQDAAGQSAFSAPADEPWLLDVVQSGGCWLTNPPCWYVPADSPEGAGNLYILLDRRILTNDLTMETEFYDATNSSLYVDLMTTNLLAMPVVSNVFGNLMLGSNEFARITGDLPLATNAQAAVIRLRRGTGAVTVCDTLLYISTNISTDVTGSENGDMSSNPFTTCRSGKARGHSNDAEEQGKGPDSAAAQAGDNKGQAGKRIIHVNVSLGSDEFDGFSESVKGGRAGPKKTIHGAFAMARKGDVVKVAEGAYPEGQLAAVDGIEIVACGSVCITDR